MSISPIGSNSPITRLQGSKAIDPAQAPQEAAARSLDTVEISDSARYLSELRKLPDIRQEKVDAVREQIAAGTYITPDKIDATVNALLQDLN